MEQIGEVVEIRNKKALVRIYRASACGENCAHCSGECKPTATMVEAVNGLGAKVGDTVKLQMNSGIFLFLAFMGYIFPIIVCIAAYFIAEHFTNNIIISDIAAIVSLASVLVVFFIIDKIRRHKSSRFSSHIIKILR